MWQQNLDLPTRSKEFTGREEDFQQRSKKTEAFFVGAIKEYEMMLEWAAEQPTDITTTAIGNMNDEMPWVVLTRSRPMRPVVAIFD